MVTLTSDPARQGKISPHHGLSFCRSPQPTRTETQKHFRTNPHARTANAHAHAHTLCSFPFFLDLCRPLAPSLAPLFSRPFSSLPYLLSSLCPLSVIRALSLSFEYGPAGPHSKPLASDAVHCSRSKPSIATSTSPSRNPLADADVFSWRVLMTSEPLAPGHTCVPIICYLCLPDCTCTRNFFFLTLCSPSFPIMCPSGPPPMQPSLHRAGSVQALLSTRTREQCWCGCACIHGPSPGRTPDKMTFV